MMILIIGLVAAAMLHSAQGDGCNRIVCYTTNWSQYRPGSGKFMPENIDPSLCTHMIYAFAKLSGNQLAAFEWNDDSTDWSVGLYQKFMNLKQKNPNVKTMLAVGGWNLGSAPFTQIAGSPGNRKAFITQAISFLRQRGFDGLDLDWEYPANRGSPPRTDSTSRSSLLFVNPTGHLQEIRQAFEEEGRSSGKGRLLLSAAVAAGKDNVDTAYDVPAVSKQVDFINLMTYDLHGSWETFTGHNSPLYARGDETGAQRNLNVDWAARYWVQKGAPKDKLNIGMGLYGRSFTLASASNHQPGAPAPRGGQAGEYTREAGFIAYYEASLVCDMIKKGATKEYIADQQVPYIHQDTQWVGYDDPDSLKKKVRYVKQNGFGGVMVWALPLDDFSGTHCNQGPSPSCTPSILSVDTPAETCSGNNC
ncbi:hypothetical protein C0Q70_00140 [Pomacea canaliculata]|uniref:GH18 domain-containing protein n=1 Tax=Pomacea canaliculata TaxID=400727 RepID=A0A2T7PVT4_POMCA|nr:hypothetical protein C0Q70_00140 [Pomacea canaliculata]